MSSAQAPLVITAIDVPGGAQLGLTHCPGRCGGAYGQRDLGADLREIEASGADLLLTLVEAHEFARLGVPEFAREASRRSFTWHHIPIPDFGTPTDATWAAWAGAKADVRQTLARGGRVLLHCAAGLGRTGSIAAKLLSELGLTPDEAIQLVRQKRPGTIETAVQMNFVRQGPTLL
jgi:ADP-ribosyl-[dinitrogen reductase] hydrolase